MKGSLTKKKSVNSNLKWALVMIAPALLLRGFTTVYPIIKTFIDSFFDIELLRGINEFCGFENYINVLKRHKLGTYFLLMRSFHHPLYSRWNLWLSR